jgi:BNR repeat-like domain
MLVLAFLAAFRLTPDSAAIEFRQPQMTVSGNTLAVTFGAGNAIYFSTSTNRGESFTPPVKVAESGVLSLGRHRGPRVAVSGPAYVISAVVGETGRGVDGDLIAWRSTDNGKTWSAGAKVNDVPGSAREGLHAMAAGPDGLLYVTWLDLRAKGTRLYGAHSTDRGVTWSKNVLVYESPQGTICECCHPSLAVGARGTVSAMWRNALDGSRDLYLAGSSDGGMTFGAPEKLGAGTWPLKGCPMDGGGLARAADGRIVSVWRREDQVYLAPAGGMETKIEEGKDPAIAATSEGVYAAWSTAAGLRARVPGKPAPVPLAPEGGYVQLAAFGDGAVVAAWETKGSIAFRVVR